MPLSQHLRGRGGQISEFQTSLVYRERSRTARATERNVSMKMQKRKIPSQVRCMDSGCMCGTSGPPHHVLSFFFFNITPLSTKGGWDTVGHGIWLPELLPEGEVANPFPLPSKQTSFLFCCRLLAVSSKPSRESPD